MNEFRRFQKLVLVCGIMAMGTFCNYSNAEDSLQTQLRQGGYVIYFRHGLASSDARADSNLPSQVKDCKGERHVTEAGVKVINGLRSQFKALKIPVGKVISSPACQAVETSWYLTGISAEIESALDGNPRDQIWSELRPFLIAVPDKGTNTILFSHSTNIKALTGLTLAEGEAVIFQPDAQGGLTFITRLKPEEWTSKLQ